MATAHQEADIPAVSDFKQISIHFANSVVWRASEQPQEMLTEPDKLLRFARWAGIFNEGEVTYLRQEAADAPEEAEAALERAKVAREATYRVLLAVANHLPPSASDMSLLNEVIAEAQAQMHLAPTETDNGFEWRWKSETPRFDMARWAAARSLAELLTSEELKKVKSCPGEGCAFLFMDLSRNGKRRWCEMDLCGNRTKVKRFRQSHHGA
ncbi:MAG: CGNR zinc finger domain-containing protein [Chloroflexota bacterium]|nr:CGNR zinc finger domain-containing protein [Chloroflexota bacterium]